MTDGNQAPTNTSVDSRTPVVSGDASSMGALRPTVLALRAWGLALGCVVVLAGLALGLGVHRPGRGFDVLVAVALAAVGGFVGAMWKARVACAPRPDRAAAARQAMQLQAAMFGDFAILLLLFAFGIVGLALRSGAWKFEGLEEFGLAFASAGFIFVVATAVAISHHLTSRRASSSSATSGNAPPPDRTLDRASSTP
jgi:hypothetical protein